MTNAQINITTHRGAIKVELAGMEGRLPASTFQLTGRNGPALPTTALAPLRWAVAAKLGGVVDPISWLEKSEICVNIEEADANNRGHRRFDVAAIARGGKTPMAMKGTAEFPTWVVKVARYVVAGAVHSQQPQPAMA